MDEQKVTAGLLQKLMSEISEEHWCAGWLIGLEYTLWEAVMKPRWLRLIGGLALGVVSFVPAMAASIEVFHPDSLAGRMRELKKAFEGKNQGVTINLTSGVSRRLAERILKGNVPVELN